MVVQRPVNGAGRNTEGLCNIKEFRSLVHASAFGMPVALSVIPLGKCGGWLTYLGPKTVNVNEGMTGIAICQHICINIVFTTIQTVARSVLVLVRKEHARGSISDPKMGLGRSMSPGFCDAP